MNSVKAGGILLVIFFIVSFLTRNASLTYLWHAYEGFWLYAVNNPELLRASWDEFICVNGPLAKLISLGLSRLGDFAYHTVYFLVNGLCLLASYAVVRHFLPDVDRKHNAWLAAVVTCALLFNPQFLAIVSGATPTSLVQLALCIICLASMRLISTSSIQWSWVLTFCVGALLFCWTHYLGWLVSLAMTVSLVVMTQGNKWKRGLIAFGGLLSIGSLFTYDQWYFAAYDHYYSETMPVDSVFFGKSIIELATPKVFKFNYWLFLITHWTVLITLGVSLIRREFSSYAKFFGLTVVLLVSMLSSIELFSGHVPVHYFQIGPVALLVLFALIGAMSALRYRCVLFGFSLLLSTFYLVDAKVEYFNADKKSMSFVASQINSDVDDGVIPIFAGSPIFFTLYPWLSDDAVLRSLVVTSGSGFYLDAFEGHRLITTDKIRQGNFLVESSNHNFRLVIIVTPEISQGFAIDLDSRWPTTTKSYFVSLRQPIGQIHLSRVDIIK